MKFLFFFFNDTATTEIYTLSLHDALPICFADREPARHSETSAVALKCGLSDPPSGGFGVGTNLRNSCPPRLSCRDRKSTRLNSSHANISYAVFCLKKKKKTHILAVLYIHH